MGKNVYIGARYVPLIDGEWIKSKSYEPLTVVTYQGASYTSKTYVPPNTDITNIKYWVCTGNYNAQVEMYRQEVYSVENRVTNLENGIPDITIDGGLF